LNEIIEHTRDGLEVNSTTFIETELDLARWYPKIQGFRFNHVISAVSSEQDSYLISNPIDRKVLKAIRSSADLIVTTGKTAVAENLSASAFAPMLIITRKKDIHVPATEESSRQRVYVTSGKSDFGNPAAEGVGEVEGNLLDWVKNFTKDYQCVVLETGLKTTLQLESLIKEICLTVVEAKDIQMAKSLADKFIEKFGANYRLLQLLQIDTNWFFRFENVSKS
jgi:hypothetical protein